MPQEPQGPADGPASPTPPWGPPPGPWGPEQHAPPPMYGPPPQPGAPTPSSFPQPQPQPQPQPGHGYQQPWGPIPGQGLPPHGQGPKRRGPGALIAGITAAVLLVAAVIVTVIVMRSRSSDDDGTAGPAATASAPDPDGTVPVAPAVPSPAVPSVPSGAATVADIAGSWSGTYTCAQGLTRLRLTILPAPPAGEVTATFGFSAHPSNPKVPAGLFAMRGTFTGGILHLRGERWIRRPAGYLMVGLTATVDQERPVSLEGTIDDVAGCTRFSVRRAGG